MYKPPILKDRFKKRSADSLVRVFPAASPFRGDKAVRAPAKILLLALLLGLAVAGCSRLETAPAAKTATAPQIPQDERTALDKYVAAPDPNYSFHLADRIPGKDQTTFILEMTSQAWLTTNEVDRPLWKHWVVLVKPDQITSSKSLLFISGGANDGKPPKAADANLVQMALTTKSVVAELNLVPN